MQDEINLTLRIHRKYFDAVLLETVAQVEKLEREADIKRKGYVA